jgi:hypothetical protein
VLAPGDLADTVAMSRFSVPDLDPRARHGGRSAIFAAGLCAGGFIVLLVSQLGWTALFAVPVYLAAVLMLSLATSAGSLPRPMLKPLLTVALATASMGMVLALVKLAGLV